MSSTVHKPGPFKQQNKSHKTGKHLSKGTLSAIRKGKIDAISLTNARRAHMSKQDRRNQAKQIRANSRLKSQMEKRLIGLEGTPPHLIVIVPLSTTIDVDVLYRHMCLACDPDATPTLPITTIISSSLKQRFTLALPPVHNLYNVLDTAKIADTLLLVYGVEQPTDYYGDLCLSCICSQGLATTFHVSQGFTEYPAKKQASYRKMIQKFVEQRFPKEKLHTVDTSHDAITLLRLLSSQKRKRHVLCCEQRPHLLVERMEHIINGGDPQDHGTLIVSGYLRGRSLSVNNLIQLPNSGVYQMSKIEAPPDPNILRPHRPWEGEMGEGDDGVKVLEVADPTKQQSLISEATPDPMEGEQTWPTEEELQEAADASKHKRRVPKGTSEYQASWIIDNEDDDNYDTREMSPSGNLEEEDILSPSAAVVDSEFGRDNSEDNAEVPDSMTDMDYMSVADDSQYDANMDHTAEMKQLELLKAEREDQMFPDEVDTPLDTPARTRFARYRGLQSFHSSLWDPKENLPPNYARIFQFDNFRRTQKRVLSNSENEDGIMVGWYITVYVDKVPSTFSDGWKLDTNPMVVMGILEHENKMSVLNFVLRRTLHHTLPIKAKERLIFHTGLRRFTAPVTFSQHTTGDKHKSERYFRPNSTIVATVFAPIEYRPSPVLVFKELNDGVHTLVATGSLLSVNPDRINCKKIILSGHPMKIHKKSAVVRYMFFSREDILWFKPVELRTKYGRRGHIKEPLGTHGHMKCTFDGQLNAQDTVMMSLYKRVFPKWEYHHEVATPTSWETLTNNNDNEDEIEDMQ
ncbi:pre-rRNA-processing protein TSR1 homolog [Dysidea avara]|uniref:pre-rRNA-processing protein TSR1 homolog n=1 Tax=Dysidea avara TaxID=196820 RepID=UPI0033284B77